MTLTHMRNAVVAQKGLHLGQIVHTRGHDSRRKRDGYYVTAGYLAWPMSSKKGLKAKSADRSSLFRVNVKRRISVMKKESSDVITKAEDGSIVIRVPSVKKMKATASKALNETQRFFSPILPFAIPFSFAALLGVLAVKLTQAPSSTNTGNRRIVYDRSLGGKAIQVTGSSSEWNVDTRSTPRSPTRAASLRKGDEKSQVRSVPDWWMSLTPIVPASRPTELQEHQQYLKDLESKRIAGRDAFLSEILQLTDACDRDNVVLTNILPSNVRESYYRDACSMIIKGILGGYQDPPSAPETIARLARTMGIDSAKGSTIVTGNVAAQLRSSLIDSAVEARRARSSVSNDLSIELMEAKMETNMIGIKRLLSAFPFQKDSPELEFLREGLRNRIQETESRAIWVAFQSITNVERDGERRIQEQIREALNVA